MEKLFIAIAILLLIAGVLGLVYMIFVGIAAIGLSILGGIGYTTIGSMWQWGGLLLLANLVLGGISRSSNN